MITSFLKSKTAKFILKNFFSVYLNFTKTNEIKNKFISFVIKFYYFLRDWRCLMKEYLEQDISEIDLKTLVRDSLNEALTNEEGLNIGTHTNHCDENIKQYYIALQNNEEWATKKQKELIESFKNDRAF